MKFDITFGIEDARGFVTHSVEARNRGEAIQKAMDIVDAGNVPPSKCSMFAKHEIISIDPPHLGPVEYVLRVQSAGQKRYYRIGCWVDRNCDAQYFTRKEAHVVCRAVSVGDLDGLVTVVRVRPRGGRKG